MWEEQARFPEGTSGAIEEINEKEAFEEIKFLTWSADDKKFSETDKALLEELKVYEEFKSLIISGSYLDVINEIKKSQGDVNEDNVQKLTVLNANIKQSVDKKETEFQSTNAIMENRIPKDIEESPDIILHSITDDHGDSLYPKDENDSIIGDGNIGHHQFITPINITTSASDKSLASAFVDDDDESCDETSGSNLSINLLPSSVPGVSLAGASSSQNMASGVSGNQQPPARASEEDNVIQDLLKDIRGSFERQFDDEFDFSER